MRPPCGHIPVLGPSDGYRVEKDGRTPRPLCYTCVCVASREKNVRPPDQTPQTAQFVYLCLYTCVICLASGVT